MEQLEKERRPLGKTLLGLLGLCVLYALAALLISLLYGFIAVAVDTFYSATLPFTTIKTIIPVSTSVITVLLLPLVLVAFFAFLFGKKSVPQALQHIPRTGLRLYLELLATVAVAGLLGLAIAKLVALIPSPLAALILLIVLIVVFGVIYLAILKTIFSRHSNDNPNAGGRGGKPFNWDMPSKALSVALAFILVVTLIPAQAAYALPPRAAEQVPNTDFERNEQLNGFTEEETPAEALLREPILEVGAEPEEVDGTEIHHDRSSRTYEMADGTFTTRIYADPLTFTDEDGDERDIDSTLVAGGDGFTNTANSYELILPQEGQAIRITNEGYTLEVAPLFGVLENAVVRDNAIRYNALAAGIDLQYTATASGVKEDIIVNHPLDDATFSFALTAEGITFIAADTVVYGYADADVVGKTPKINAEPVFILTAPKMTDNAGAYSQDIKLSLKSDGEGSILKVIPNKSWLDAPERAYPVIIDPTYQLGSGNLTYGTIQVNPSGLSAGPNIEHRSGYLYAGFEDGSLVATQDWDGTWIAYGQSRAFIKINDVTPYLTGLPDVAILSAKLVAYRYSGDATTRSVSAKMIASDWQGSAYTWNNQPANYTDLANAQDVSRTFTWVTWDISDAFRAWKNNPATNRGIMLTPVSESQHAVTFSGPGNSHGQQDLYFELSWTVPNPVDENLPLDAPEIKLRPYTAKDGASGLQNVTGLSADGVVRPALDVNYRLTNTDGTEDTGTYPNAEWGRIFPDSTGFESEIDFTLGYTELYESNWQTKLFTTFAQNIIYNVFATATNGILTTPEGKSDDFIIYEFTETDTLPYVASYYGVTVEQLIRDNRVQDDLAFAGNTLFIRNPTQNATVPYTRPDDLNLAHKRALIYASMGRNMTSEFDIEPVDMALGNFSFESVDATSSDYTTNFELTRSYNALAPKTSGAFGLGWSFAYLQTLTGRADGGMTYARGDGKILVFDKGPAGTFISPVGYGYTLVKHDATDPHDVTYTITDAAGTTTAFDSYGLLSSVTDKYGNTTQVTHDGDYHISGITTPSGKVYAITTNAIGQITRVVLPNTGELIYGYTGDTLTSFTNADGDTVRYLYDAKGLLTEWYDGNNNRMIANTYDAQGRVIAQIDAASGVSTLAYTDTTTTLVDAAGNTTTYTLDADMRITHIEGARLTETRSYDSENRLASTTDAFGNTTSYTYDGRGNITREERADGSYQELAYDAAGNPTSVRDFAGNITTNTYSVSGYLTQTTLADGTTITYARDAYGRPTAITDGDGNTTTFAWTGTASVVTTNAEGDAEISYFDPMGNVINLTDALGTEHKVSFTRAGKLTGTWITGGIETQNLFDAAGNCVATIDADDSRIDFTYDAQNNLTSATDALGNTMTYTYDALGNKTSQTDATGNTTVYTLDGADRVTAITDAAGTTTTNTYNALGNLTSSTDAYGETTNYTYDTILGLLLSKTSFAGTETYTYDALGNITSYTSADGRQTSYTYDALSRQTSQTTPTGLQISYTYDSNGNLTKTEDSEGRTEHYSYDGASRPVGFIDAEGTTFSYGYDSTGNLITETLPDGATYTYAYDVAGNVTQILYPDGLSETFTYDGRGNITSATDRAGETSTYAYDARGSLTAATDALGGVVTYTYTSQGLPEKTTGALTEQTVYAYDTLNRPTTVTDPLGNSTQLTYDAAGRATRVASPDGSAVESTYDAAGRLTKTIDAVGYEVIYAYDTYGRVSSWADNVGATMDFTYDASGRLTEEVDALGRHSRYEYDVWDNLTRQTDLNGDTTRFVYNKLNQKIAETGPDGRETTYTYDVASRLIASTNAEGDTTAYAYDVLGNLIRTTDALGQTTAYTYDAALNLASITFADGSLETREYDALGRLTKVTDGNGNATAYTYDASSRLIAETYADGTTTEVAYDAAANVIAQKDEEGFVTTLAYDEVGRLIRATSPRGAEITYAYDGQGNLATSTDPLGATTRYERLLNGSLKTKTLPNSLATNYAYDAAGRLTSVADSAGLALTLTYDEAGNIATETDQAGNAYRYAYDVTHHITQTTDPLGTRTKNDYDTKGNLVKSTLPNGATVTYAYDALGRMIQGQKPQTAPVDFTYDELGRLTQTSQAAKLSSYAYDNVGNLTSTTDPLAHTSSYAYDERNRLVSATNAKGATSSIAYSPTSRVAQTTDALGNTRAYAYDADGNVTTTTDELGYSTSYYYDLAANLTEVADAKGRRTVMDYDAMGNMVKKTAGTSRTYFGYDLHNNLTYITSPDGTQEKFEYDVASRLTRTINPDGSTISYDYDALDSLIAKRYSTDETNVAYAYDTSGLRKSMQDATGISTYTYNAAGRIASYTNGDNKILSYTYDIYGRMETVTYPDGRLVTYSYDLADNLTKVSDSKQGVVTYAYDVMGNVTNCTRPDGLVTTYTYDAAGRLLTLINKRAGEAVSSFAYTYDAKGQIATEDATQTGSSYHRVFTYDEVAELVGIDEIGTEGAEVTTYSYDDTGNRVATVKGVGNYRDVYTYDTEGHLLKAKDGKTGEETKFTYDANGNLISKTGAGKSLTYSYDIENRLKAVHEGGELLMAATYDGDGNRTFTASKMLVPIYYTYEGESPTLEPAKLTDTKAKPTEDTKGSVTEPEETKAPAEPDEPVIPPTQTTDSLFWYGFTDGIIEFASVLDPAAAPALQIWLYTIWERGLGTGEGDESPRERNERALAATGISEKDIEAVLAEPKKTADKPSEDILIPVFEDSYIAVDYELTYYLNDVSMKNVQVAAEYGEADNLKDSYIYGTERLFDTDETTGSTQTYLYDGRGSVTQRADAAGIQAEISYNIYGEVLSGINPYEVTYAFNGEEYSDTTGLQYLRARYYSPETANFITQDTTLGTLTRINSQNRYAFAEADPLNNADPTGHAISANAYERQMEDSGGINELYNFYVGHALTSSYNQATAAFNARLGYAQGVNYTSMAAINSISQITQAEADFYIVNGARAALAVGQNYGCSPGSITATAITSYATNVQIAKEVTNQRIETTRQNKIYQWQQYQAYLAWLAEQARIAAALEAAEQEAARQYRFALADYATRFMEAQTRAIQAQQAAQRAREQTAAATNYMLRNQPTVPKQLAVQPQIVISPFTQKPVDVASKASVSLSDLLHGVLDVFGMFPVIGEPFDAVNGVWYAIEGDALNAGLSFSALIPVAGMAVTVSKQAGKVALNAIDEAAGLGAKYSDDIAESAMFGSKGVQVTSKTVWNGKNGLRIDVENPNPGQRAGQIHVQDAKGNKYYFDPDSRTFKGAPASINALLKDSNFVSGLNKGLEKYLGEPGFTMKGIR